MGRALLAAAVGASRCYFNGVFVDLPDGISGRHDRPLLVLSEHHCAWDVTIALVVCRALDREVHVLAHRNVLARHRYLTRVGLRAVPVGDPLAASGVLSDETKWLTAGPGRALWNFAAGEHVRPARGASVPRGNVALARQVLSHADTIVVSYRYEFLRGARPWVWLLGRRLELPSKATIREHGEAIDTALRKTRLTLDRHLVDGTGAFQSVLAPKDVAVVGSEPLQLGKIARAAGVPTGGLDADSLRRAFDSADVAHRVALEKGPLTARLLRPEGSPK